MTEHAHATGTDTVTSAYLKIFKNICPSTRCRIHSVFNKIHFGKRIQKAADSSTVSTGHVWTGGQYAWTGPAWDNVQPRFQEARHQEIQSAIMNEVYMSQLYML